jgi:hypothetical protein
MPKFKCLPNFVQPYFFKILTIGANRHLHQDHHSITECDGCDGREGQHLTATFGEDNYITQ